MQQWVTGTLLSLTLSILLVSFLLLSPHWRGTGPVPSPPNWPSLLETPDLGTSIFASPIRDPRPDTV